MIKRYVDRDTATRLFNALRKLVDTGVITLEDESGYLGEALEIALNNNITVYDSLYIAQARRYSALITSDRKQAEIAEIHGVRIHYIP